MSDLINRQDAIDLVEYRMKHNPMKSVEFIQGLQDAYLQVLSDLHRIPPTERRGKWIRTVLGSTSGYGTTVMYQCSECEKMAISEYHYCPNCGSYMRGDENEIQGKK